LPELFASRRARVQEDAEARQAQLYEEIGRLKVELDWLNRKTYRVS
jgi:putative transposase